MNATLLLVVALLAALGSAQLRVKSAERTVDLRTQNAQGLQVIELENVGSAAVSSFVFSLPASLASHVAYVSARHNASSTALSTSAPRLTPSSVEFTVSLGSYGLKSKGDAVVVAIVYVLTNVQTPYPAEIPDQFARQYMRYVDSAYVWSNYEVSTQSSTFKLPSNVVESKTTVKPTSAVGEDVIYGPYSDIKSSSSEPITLHYMSNAAFFSVAEQVREYEVSHWGNLAVEDTYKDILHVGAKFTGTFNRLVFARQPTPHAITRFVQLLPGSAFEVYYRDEIGNISSSHYHVNQDNQGVLELFPRFPLFGGWKTAHYSGFNLPLEQALAIDASGRYVLTVPFAAPLNESVVSRYTVRVILPEGSTDIKVESPYSAEEQRSKHFTYLDTSGRPVVVLSRNNVVGQHTADLKVSYSFSSYSMLQEPLLLVAAFFVLCFTIIVAVRLDFGLSH